MNSATRIVVLVVAAVAIGGGGFAAGMTVASASPQAGAAATPSPSAAAGRRAIVTGPGGAGGGQVAGRVLSVGDGSITVEVRQPGSDQARSVIALVGGDARIVRTTETEIGASDIKVGEQVLVIGQPDASTGAVAASAVVVGFNALQQLFGGGGQGGGAPAGSGAPRRATPSPSPTR